MNDAADNGLPRIEIAVCIMAGAAIGLASLAWLSWRIGDFEINAVSLSLFVAPSLYFLWSNSANGRRAWFAICGCALAGAGYLLEHPHVLAPATITFGVICVTAFLLLSQIGSPKPPKRLDALIATASAVTAIAIYRVFAALAADIPNEDRSLIVGGYEVHHLNVGLAGTLLLSAIAAPTSVVLRVIYFVLLGSALGGWIDQIGYYLHATLGDGEYGEPVSVAGAIVGAGLLSASAAIGARKSLKQ